MKKNLAILAIFSILITYNLFSFERAVVTVDELQLRRDPDINSKILKLLKAGEKAEIINRSEEREKIGANNYHWYKLKLEDNVEGWAYGGFLEILTQNFDLVWMAEIPEIKPGEKLDKAKVTLNNFADGSKKFPFGGIQNKAFYPEEFKKYLLLINERGNIDEIINLTKSVSKYVTLENIEFSNNYQYLLSETYSFMPETCGIGSSDFKYMNKNLDVIYQKNKVGPMGREDFTSHKFLITPKGDLVYVSNTPNGKIEIINNRGETAKVIDFKHPIELTLSQSGEYILCVNKSANIAEVVTDDASQIIVYTTNGDFVKKITPEETAYIKNIFCDQNYLLVFKRPNLYIYDNFNLKKTIKTDEKPSWNPFVLEPNFIKISVIKKKIYLVYDDWDDKNKAMINNKTVIYDLLSFDKLGEFSHSQINSDQFIIEPNNGNIIITANGTSYFNQKNAIYFYDDMGKLLFSKTTGSYFYYKDGYFYSASVNEVKLYKVIW